MLPSSIKLIYFDPLGGHLHLPPPPSNLFPYMLIPSPLSPLLISPPLATKCSQLTAYIAPPLPHLTSPCHDQLILIARETGLNIATIMV